MKSELEVYTAAVLAQRARIAERVAAEKMYKDAEQAFYEADQAARQAETDLRIARRDYEATIA
jgi:hypothetical protein